MRESFNSHESFAQRESLAQAKIETLGMTYIITSILDQNSVGVSASGSFGGASASLNLDINTLSESVDKNTRIGNSLVQLTIGSNEVPLPIHVKLVTIDNALTSSLWGASERSEINQKKTHLIKALTDYATNKGAGIAAGRLVHVMCACDVMHLLH